MSQCVECHHNINAKSHERCRTHADCANGRQYHVTFCGVCHSLWYKARDHIANPVEAREAFVLLQDWIAGFARNSKGRPKGVDYFSDFEERREFEHLRSVFQISRRASSMESSSSSILSQRVSVSHLFNCFYLLFIVI